jgi:MFS family permease
METRALTHIAELPPLPAELPIVQKPKPIPYMEIFKNPMYRNRTILLFLVWFFGYMTVYIFAGGLSTILGNFFPFPENGMIVALGIFGFIIAGVISSQLGDKLERKRWLPISAVITLIGGIAIAEGTTNIEVGVLGAILLFTGTNIWVPITYAWVSESFPTRARASGFALADGLGHIGGGVGLLIVAALLTSGLAILPLFIVIAIFQIISAVISQFGPSTSNKRLDEISP